MGGISRTETYKGYRFDIGGHRFFTKVSAVEKFWREILPNDFIKRDRLSRIYYQGKFYSYPLELGNALGNLGPFRSARICASYLRAKIKTPYKNEKSLEEWVINRFGRELYLTFFKTYTEKVWGIPCSEIRADWAAQRIRGMSLKRAVLNAIGVKDDTKSLIRQFDYPTLGPGMMWDRCAEVIEAEGGEVRRGAEVTAIEHEDGKVKAVCVRYRDGREERIVTGRVINSMPISLLVQRLDPLPPERVLRAAKGLHYRDFLIVVLILKQKDVFPDNWIYVHSPEVTVGRIQNFKNWSPAMVPDENMTALGMEYFCNETDEFWKRDDGDLIKQAAQELEKIGLGKAADAIDGCVIRQKKAYPVYDSTYKSNVAVLKDYITTFDANLQTVGRAGMHRYNNQDHSMLTAMLAVENFYGAKHDLWSVNVERSYHEDFTTSSERKSAEEAATSDPRRELVGTKKKGGEALAVPST